MDIAATDLWRRSPIALFLLEEDHVGPAYLSWLNDPVVSRFLESRFAQHSEESTRAFVAAARSSANTLFMGIRDDRLGRHVGNIKLGPIDRHHRLGEIGLMIGDRAAWGQGVGTAAIVAIAAIARDQLGLRKLTAGCYASNVGSRKAFEKAGFVLEGIRPAHFLLDGQPEDLLLLGQVL